MGAKQFLQKFNKCYNRKSRDVSTFKNSNAYWIIVSSLLTLSNLMNRPQKTVQRQYETILFLQLNKCYKCVRAYVHSITRMCYRCARKCAFRRHQQLYSVVERSSLAVRSYSLSEMVEFNKPKPSLLAGKTLAGDKTVRFLLQHQLSRWRRVRRGDGGHWFSRQTRLTLFFFHHCSFDGNLMNLETCNVISPFFSLAAILISSFTPVWVWHWKGDSPQTSFSDKICAADRTEAAQGSNQWAYKANRGRNPSWFCTCVAEWHI